MNGKVNTITQTHGYSMKRFLFRSLKKSDLAFWMHMPTHSYMHTHSESKSLTYEYERSGSLKGFEGWIWFLDAMITIYCFPWVSNCRDRLSKLKHQNRLHMNFLISLSSEAIRRTDKYFGKTCSKLMNNQGSGWSRVNIKMFLK